MFGTKTKPNGFPSTTQLLPLLGKMGEFLKKGFEHYVQMSLAGTKVSPEALQTYIFIQMSSWNPVLKGKKILDVETKQALSRFLSGVAINLYTDGE